MFSSYLKGGWSYPWGCTIMWTVFGSKQPRNLWHHWNARNNKKDSPKLGDSFPVDFAMQSNAEKLLNVNWFIVRDIKEKKWISFAKIIQLSQRFCSCSAGGMCERSAATTINIINVKFINTRGLCIFTSRHECRLWGRVFWLIPIIHGE